MRGVLRVLLFVVAGPYVGLLAMAVLIGTYTLVTTGSTRDFTFGPELVSPGLLIVAYSVGGIPALLTGIAAIFIARWKSSSARWLLTALAGGIISLAETLVLFGGGPELLGVREEPQIVVVVTLAGAIAGFICAMLFDGLVALLGRRVA